MQKQSPRNQKNRKRVSSGKILGKSSSYYKEGLTLYVKEKKYAEAIAAFDKALEVDNKLAHVWNDRGTCFRDMGDHTRVHSSPCSGLLNSHRIIRNISYNLGETLEMIGIMYMSNKYLDSAIQTFKMVVNLMPNNASAWNHLGICLKEIGKEEEAKFYFDRARDIITLEKGFSDQAQTR